MTYTPTQLEVIKTFGRKELSDYCLVKVDGKYIFRRDTSILEFHYEILGHIPHLEDVFRVSLDNGNSIEIWKESEYCLCFSQYKRVPYNPTIPLIEQPESVLNPNLLLMKKIKFIKGQWNITQQKFIDTYYNFNDYAFIRVWNNDELDDKFCFRKCKTKKSFVRFLRKHIIPFGYKGEFQLCGKFTGQNSLIYINS